MSSHSVTSGRASFSVTSRVGDRLRPVTVASSHGVTSRVTLAGWLSACSAVSADDSCFGVRALRDSGIPVRCMGDSGILVCGCIKDSGIPLGWPGTPRPWCGRRAFCGIPWECCKDDASHPLACWHVPAGTVDGRQLRVTQFGGHVVTASVFAACPSHDRMIGGFRNPCKRGILESLNHYQGGSGHDQDQRAGARGLSA